MIRDKEFHDFVNKRNEPGWLKKHRLSFFSKLAKAEMPQYKYGTAIAIKPAKMNITLPSEEPTIVITHEKDIESSTEANDRMLTEFFGVRWDDPEEHHIIHYLSESCMNNIVMVHIPEKKVAQNPILVSIECAKGAITHICIKAGANSKARVIVHKKGKANFIIETTKVLAEVGSSIEVIQVDDLPYAQNFSERKAIAARDAEVVWNAMILGGSYIRSTAKTFLNSQGSSTRNTVLYIGAKDQLLDIYTAAYHNAPHTNSDSLTKGIVAGNAKALSRGLVYIDAGAPGSNGYEKQDALLLSSTAEADAIPNLEIHNPDVKCSHGSTIGKVDKEKMFYLMSRGIARKEAEQMIIHGFFSPILEKINNEEIAEAVQEAISQI